MYLTPLRPSLQAALRDIEHADARVRIQAAEALGAVGGADPVERDAAAAALRARLGDRSPDVRYVAALGLGELKDATAVPLVLDRLEEESDPLARQALLIALGNIGDRTAAPAVHAALAEGSADVRFQATSVLVQLDPEAAGPPLRGALEDPDAEVRGAAAAALGDLGAAAYADALTELLEDPVPSVALEAALALARGADRRGTAVLVEALGRSDVHLLAAEGLYRAPDPGASASLRAALSRWFAPDLLKVWAAAALARLGDATGRAALVRLLRKREPMVRGLAIQLLGEAGAPWATEALTAFGQTRAGRCWQEEVTAALGG